MNAKTVIGVDGGGSHTRAVWMGQSGELLGVAEGRGSNYQEVGIVGLKEILGELLGPWLAQAGVQPPACICLGLAGAGRSAEQRAIVEGLEEMGWAESVRAESDARTALAGAHAGGAGMIAIAGTGSMVLGCSRRGEWVRAGGWGPILGDEGSGYDIGLRGIRAALAAHDGSGPKTRLYETLLEAVEMEAWEGVVPRVYGGDLTRARLAALAPQVLQEAEGGDRVALDILAEAAGGIARQIAAVARRLDLAKDGYWAPSGGLVTASAFFCERIEDALRSQGVLLTRVPVRLPPVLGAVLLAWEALGIALDRVVTDKLDAVASELRRDA